LVNTVPMLDLCFHFTNCITVKTFRTLVSGEDAELKATYERFHKAVKREQGVVRIAILSGVEQLKVESIALQTDVKRNLASTELISNNLDSVAQNTERLDQYLKGKLHACVQWSSICSNAISRQRDRPRAKGYPLLAVDSGFP
jgi:copper homeostasis protein CutC